MSRKTAPELDASIVIAAPPNGILKAFFEADALSAWCQVKHAVTLPRVRGPYAVGWPITAFGEEILGRLGGVCRGTGGQCQAGTGFLVADAYFLPPDSDPIGPMAFEVTCTPADGDKTTRVHVSQRGFEENPRWRRYYEVISLGWEQSLSSLKSLLEQ